MEEWSATILDPYGTPYGGRRANQYLLVALGPNEYEHEDYDRRDEVVDYAGLLALTVQFDHNNRGGPA